MKPDLRTELQHLLETLRHWSAWSNSQDIHRYTEARARARELNEKLKHCPQEC